jgi:hypothetical protein
MQEGPNLYAYVGNNPINAIDPLGLMLASPGGCCEKEKEELDWTRDYCAYEYEKAQSDCEFAWKHVPEIAEQECAKRWTLAYENCQDAAHDLPEVASKYLECLKQNRCEPSQDCPSGGGPPPGDPPPCEIMHVYSPIVGALATAGGVCK